MKLNRAQYIFLNELDTTYTGYVGGMGSAKTFSLVLSDMMFKLKYPKTPTAIYEPSFRLIKDIIYPKAVEVSRMLDCKVVIKRGDKEIDLYRNGFYYGTTFCHTMDDPNNIMGAEYAHICVDEMDRLNTKQGLDAWDQITSRLRYYKPEIKTSDMKVRVGTTPEGFKSVYELFYKKPGADYSMVQSSTYENEHNLMPGYIERLKGTYDSGLIQAYLMGEFVNLESGTVYRCYDRIKHRSNETVQGDERLYIGMDFNIDHMCAVIYVRRGEGGQEWHAVDEVVNAYNTEEVCDILEQRYPSNHKTIYPDSTGRKRNSATMKGASESDIAVLISRKLKIKAKDSNPRVKDRIQAQNNAYDKGRLFLNDEKCPFYAECQEQQCYNDNNEPDKKSGKDHANDAGSYPIAYEMPIKRPVTKMQIGYAM